VRRHRYESLAGGTDAPVDDLIDLAHQSVSLAVREMGCRISTDSGSFTRAAANLDRVGQLKLSDETLRQVVEGEGRAVLAWQDQEQLELDFDAGQCVTNATEDASVTTRAYVGIDGFMAPMVTDAEKSKRFEKARARRQRLPRRRAVGKASVGVRRPPLVRRRGADQRYKEFKLVEIYDQDRRHKLMRVTRHGPDRVGKMLRAMAEDVHLHRAEQLVAVTDGAEWIAGLIDRNLPKKKTTVILDFYHAAEHVHQTRRTVFGEENAEGKQWAGTLIEGMLQQPFDTWWDELVKTRGRTRAATKRQSLDGLMHYLLKRREKLDYARFRSMGLIIGSGSTESGCKSESRRLKGVGMRWNAANAEAMMALESLHQSNLWPTYWQSRLKVAA
jgi:hypothetical protein